jgi:transcriptional regulator with XRE-family HTH domain
MTPEAFRAALAALGMSQARLARILEMDKTAPHRWATGLRPVPKAVELLLDAWRRRPGLIPEEGR